LMNGLCKCGCGEEVSPSRKYVDNEHKIRHMQRGAALEMNRKQSQEGKRRGGSASGRKAAESGRLAAAGLRGAAKAKLAAEAVRRDQGRTASASTTP
jgi:hypothetical protein